MIAIPYAPSISSVVINSAFLISIIVAFYFLYLALNDKITVIGWASVILSIWFFGGMFLSSVGIVGFYIGKTFDQTKKRPSYIISKKLNFD